MSRFWAGAEVSSSEHDSDAESDQSAAEAIKQGPAAAASANRWAYDSDSESEDEVRVVRSAKDKAWEAIRQSATKIKNAMKINDWSSILEEFEKLMKETEKPKTKTAIASEGPPSFLVKILADLEDSVNKTLKDKALVKNMKGDQQRALKKMNLSKKKMKPFEETMNAYRANPEDFAEEEEDDAQEDSEEDEEKSSDEDDDEDSEDEEDDEEEEDSKTKPKPKPTGANSDSDDDEEDDDEDDDDDDDDALDGEDVSDDDESEDEEEAVVGQRRLRWVKKTPVEKTTNDKQVKDDNKVEKEKRREDKRRLKKETEERPKAAMRMDEGKTAKELMQTVQDLTRQRGKKKSEDAKQMVLRQLEGLAKASVRFGPETEIQVALAVVRARFDNQRIIDSFMDIQSWRSCYRYLFRIVTLLELNPSITIATPAVTEDLVVDPDADMGAAMSVLASFTSRLKDEYVKSLQGTNPGTHEYEQRRYDEGLLVKLAEKVQAYYVRNNDMSTAAVVALMQIEHTYYMHDSRATLTRRTQAFLETWGEYKNLHPACNSANAIPTNRIDVTTTHPAAALGKPSFEATEVAGFVEPSKRIQDLCTFVYAHGEEKSEVKHRALLMHVFYLAHHDQFFKARDMFLISHLQDGIEKAEPVTQILYNRTLTQMGLSAFKLGYIQKAFDCLHPLFFRIGSSHLNVKKLLGQGFSSRHDRDAEQERLERRRQIPSHMQIVVDLVDSVYLTSSLLLEVPYVARGAYHHSSNQRFVKMLEKRIGRQKGTPDMMDRFGGGPPENTQDHVLAGAAALLRGDWQKCRQYVVNLPSWAYYSGQGTADRVRSLLEEKIKCEGLRTYMLRFSQHYESMSLSQLCQMFELDERIVKKVVSKMVFEKELSAAWANPPTSLVFFKTEPSPLQEAALGFAERAAQMVESNERLLDARAGGYGYKDEWSGRDRDQRDHRKPWMGQSKRPQSKYSQAPRQGNRDGSGRGFAQNRNRRGGGTAGGSGGRGEGYGGAYRPRRTYDNTNSNANNNTNRDGQGTRDRAGPGAGDRGSNYNRDNSSRPYH